MKKLQLLSLSLFCVFSFSYAQNTLPTNGNVGIGTTSPSQLLSVGAGSPFTVTATGAVTAPSFTDGYTSYNLAQINRPSGYVELQYNTTQGVRIGGAAPANLIVNGNIGVGTTSPTTITGFTGLTLNNSTTGSLIDMQVSGTTVGRLAGISAGVYLQNITNGPIVFSTNGADRVRIDASGNVGIGVTSTNGYALAVNGSAIATSIKVTANSGGSWPDFVFKQAYKLPTLKSVKTYIDKNHHLPNMPSAGDVAKNDINLGEMVKLQTQKIEELTLYLIEKDTEIKALKQSQEKEMDDLKKQVALLTQTLNKK